MQIRRLMFSSKKGCAVIPANCAAGRGRDREFRSGLSFFPGDLLEHPAAVSSIEAWKITPERVPAASRTRGCRAFYAPFPRRNCGFGTRSGPSGVATTIRLNPCDSTAL